jgi:hypothetical protein
MLMQQLTLDAAFVGELLHYLVQLVAVLMHAGAHPIYPSQAIPLKVCLRMG